MNTATTRRGEAPGTAAGAPARTIGTVGNTVAPDSPAAGSQGRGRRAGRARISSGGLGRDLAVLERLADSEAAGEIGLGVSTLAELLGREKSQVSRALLRLAGVGLVERDPGTRRYRLGWTVFSLAARAAGGRLVQAAIGQMRALSAELGETVHLCVLDGADLVTLRTSSAGHGYRAAGWVGSRVPAHGTSAGRALLFDATRVELERRFGGVSLAASGPRAHVRDLDSLADVIAEGARAGFATVDEEFAPGVAGVSAPIRDFRGAIVAALNVSAPADRLRPRLREAAERTRSAAEAVSRQLGWAGPDRNGPGNSGPS